MHEIIRSLIGNARRYGWERGRAWVDAGRVGSSG